MNDNHLPALPGDALERMQSAVMGRISVHERHKQQRRVALGGGAALLVAATVVGSLAAGGLGGPVDIASPASASGDKAVASEFGGDTSMSGGMAGEDMGIMGGPTDFGGPSIAEAPTSPDAKSTDRQVIVNGWASVLVPDVAEAVSELSSLAASYGGHVQSRSQYGEGMDATGSITVRVPATSVNPFIEALRELGTVQQVRLGEDDVTLQVTDLASRISSLRASVERLEQLMAEADSVTELLEAESQLSLRQSELESLLSQQAYLSENVALATLTVELTAKPAPVSIEPEGFEGGLLAGWNALVGFFSVLMVGLGLILPWLGLLIVLGLLIWLIVRLRRGRRAPASAAEAAPPAPPLPKQ